MKTRIYLTTLIACFSLLMACKPDKQSLDASRNWGSSKVEIEQNLKKIFSDSLVAQYFVYSEIEAMTLAPVESNLADTLKLLYVKEMYKLRRLENPNYLESNVEQSTYFPYTQFLTVINDLKNARPLVYNSDVAFGIRLYHGFYKGTHPDVSSYLNTVGCSQYAGHNSPIAVITYNNELIKTRTILSTNGNPINTYFNLGGLCPPGCSGVTVCPSTDDL
jgi:hypothetical protein